MIFAQGDFDWIETVIFVAVVLASALGSIAKPLIRKFTPKEKEKDRDAKPVARRRPVETERPRRPVARPLAPRPVAPAPLELPRPVVKPRPRVERAERSKPEPPPDLPLPEPLRDVLSELMPELVPPREPEPPHEPAVPPPTRPPVPPAPRVRPPAAKKKRTRRTEHTAESAEQDYSLVDLRAAVDAPQSTEAYKIRKRREAETPEERKAKREDVLAQVRAPTLQSLRFAIIMSEVLAPPLALREEHDPWM